MAKFLLVYHGGKMPESPEEGARMMDAWDKWFGSLGSAVVDGGNPVGASSTKNSDGSVANNGGSNPTSGYSLLEASVMDEALHKAKTCPVLSVGGSIEVAQAIDM